MMRWWHSIVVPSTLKLELHRVCCPAGAASGIAYGAGARAGVCLINSDKTDKMLWQGSLTLPTQPSPATIAVRAVSVSSDEEKQLSDTPDCWDCLPAALQSQGRVDPLKLQRCGAPR